MSSNNDFWHTPAGEMPRSWRATRLRELAHEVTDRAGDRNGLPVLSVTKHRGIVRADTYFNKAVHSRETANYKLVRRGQFAYATIHLDEGSIGRLTSEDIGLVSPMYTVFEITDDLDPGFLLALLKSPRYLARYAALGRGTVNRRASISFDALGSLVIHHPPLAEQRATAAVLRAIDESSRKTRKLISHLEAVKDAVMTGLLSRGILGKHSEFKTTRVGRIPVVWEVRRIDAVANVASGSTPDRNRKDYWEHGTVPWIASGKVNEGFITTPSEHITGKALRESRLSLLPAGTVLMALYGQGKTRGMVARLGLTACINQALASIVPHRDVSPDYLYAFLRHQYQRLRRASRGTTQDNLNCGIIKSYPILVPPPEEQAIIAAFSETFDRRIVAERIYLDQLQETKRGLAQALLSGRVRVPPQAVRREEA